ncbi:MAG TPA: hypothetical protein DEP53_15330, partial [Bacteroidetes bacterium]|nr:hypothetical protein [Bacteroidota bacterium]
MEVSSLPRSSRISNSTISQGYSSVAHTIQEIPADQAQPQRPRRPDWLKAKIPGGEGYARLKSIIDANRLHTVREEARCPHMGECWHSGTA